jgi:hypothetical protein
MSNPNSNITGIQCGVSPAQMADTLGVRADGYLPDWAAAHPAPPTPAS